MIPKEALRRLTIEKGASVHVRLTPNVLSGNLKARKVTEKEIERIAALQLEPRENVVRFLSTESVLSGNKVFLKRLHQAGRKR
ncbi:MAG TPA: hypothetical protein VMM37_06340 [Bacteroidota bacterium]|nr:hypothetical protein [Bacteroidota bacterium]